MKKFFIRISTMIMAVFTLAIMAALPVTAFAAENEVAAVVVEEEVPAYTEQEEVIYVQAMANTYEEPVIQQLGNPQGGGQPQGGSKSGSSSADAAYENTMDFIITWIRRVGAAIALFGGFMLALGLKNNEPEPKERGIMAMVAGFVVWAICGAVDMFDLFS
ncbi:hypothetical protein [Ruminococcus sp.]|jgi:hypothetical protein|uniref:hypothetical protein n=1 Tax=Ruminococcus sp. TaxID=41978 RepID=UPI0025DD873E|nr:hypothetical protein [Ruminococcus sp.]